MRAIILVTASLGLLLGGCYEVDKPIITRDIAIEVPGLNGDVLSSNGAAVGFADTPSFSHAFKRVFGLPPSRARRDFAGL
jgi:hypothetical protein